MKAWAEEELRYAELGDVRRKKRLIRIVSDLAAQPNVSVPQASGDLAATQAAYEFWQSPYIKPEAICASQQRFAIALSHQKSTTERVKQQPIAIATWLLLSPFAATSVKSDLVKKDVTNA